VTKPPTRVAIVVDPDFGRALADLARRVHVWIVDTPENRRVVEQLWAQASEDPNEGITTFKVDFAVARDAWVVDILPVVDEHHGLRVEWAPSATLEVRGARLTPGIRAALDELGSFSLEESEGGFVANRAV
jgi:hypothetical protein